MFSQEKIPAWLVATTLLSSRTSLVYGAGCDGVGSGVPALNAIDRTYYSRLCNAPSVELRPLPAAPSGGVVSVVTDRAIQNYDRQTDDGIPYAACQKRQARGTDEQGYRQIVELVEEYGQIGAPGLGRQSVSPKTPDRDRRQQARSCRTLQAVNWISGGQLVPWLIAIGYCFCVMRAGFVTAG